MALHEMAAVDAALSAHARQEASEAVDAGQAPGGGPRESARNEHGTTPQTQQTLVTTKVKTGPSTQGFARVSNEGGLIDIITQSEIQSTDRGLKPKEQQNALQNIKGSDQTVQAVTIPPLQLRNQKLQEKTGGTQMLTPIQTEKTEEEIHSDGKRKVVSNKENEASEILSPATAYKDKDDSTPQPNSNP